MSRINDRLQELGLTLPQLTPPVANYVPFTISGNTLYVSGQLPVEAGVISKGLLGKDISVEQGRAAARLCAINIIAQVSAALGGDLDRVTRCLRLGGFVASTPDFFDHPKVINGASDLIVDVFGDAGKHARAAVGVSALPLGACVEVDAIFEIK
ncbi:MAG TPA: RidA family protein [Patescibacteria group bacterium]|nr:RidA family protein [Patescibacteria group bacterium]